MSLFNITKFMISSIPLDENIDMLELPKKTAFRIDPNVINFIRTDHQKNIELRKKISMLFHDGCTKGSYEKIELKAQIKRNTFQKWLSGNRKISRGMLAKFVVGLELDVEAANELFALHSHGLDPQNNRFDCIIAATLNDGDDIEIFEEEVKKYFD